MSRPRVLVLAVAVLQVALPASLLAARWATEGSQPVSELPASWQMYSATGAPSYVGSTADGARRPLDVAALPPVLRRVGTGEVVPRRLCDAAPDLVAVERTGGVQPGRYPC